MSTEETEYQDPTFSHELKGKVAKLKSKPGKRGDGDASFHDSFEVSATMGYSLMHEVLAAMGVSNTTFVDDLPDEAPSIEIHRHFRDHTLKIKGSGRVLARFDNLEVLNFTVLKESETTHRISFTVKGLPTLQEHFNLERCILDCHTGALFMLEFGEPPQEDMFGGDEEDAGKPAASNVTQLPSRE